MNFARRDPVGARTGGCEQGLSDLFFKAIVVYKLVQLLKLLIQTKIVIG